MLSEECTEPACLRIETDAGTATAAAFAQSRTPLLQRLTPCPDVTQLCVCKTRVDAGRAHAPHYPWCCHAQGVVRHGFGQWRDILLDGELGLQSVLREELGYTPAAMIAQLSADKVLHAFR